MTLQTITPFARWRLLRHAPIVLALLLTAGCANTNQFQRPIAAFSTATTTATMAIQALDKEAAKNLTALREAKAVDAGRIRERDGSCATSSSDCVLELPPAQQINYKTLIPNSVAFMAGMRDYASALDGIAKADASPKVEAAFGQALGGLASIATTMNLAAGAVISAISKPLTDVGTWGFLQYQSGIKMDALCRATEAAEPIIKEAAPILSGELEEARTAQLASLTEDLNQKQGAFEFHPTATNLHAAVVAANALDTALSAKPADVIAKLVKAHSALAQAVASPKPDLTQLTATITAFVQQANNIRTIVDKIESASAAAPAKP